jgi:hypothetical protein
MRRRDADRSTRQRDGRGFHQVLRNDAPPRSAQRGPHGDLALAGARPRGARPVAGTHLMAVARVVALVLVGVMAYAAWSGLGSH